MGDIRSENSAKNLTENCEKVPASVPPNELSLDREIVVKILQDYNGDLDLISYEIEPGSSLGDGFTAVLLALKVQAKNTKNGGNLEEIQLMVKTLPKADFRKSMLLEMKAFDKETRFYTQILADFEKFQRSKGVKECDLFLAYPKCYSALVDGKNDYIAMENLKLSGHILGRKRGLNLEHCTIALQNLAKFHAISYAKFGGDFESIVGQYGYLKESLFNQGNELFKNFLLMFKSSHQMEKDLMLKAGHLDASKIFDEINIDDLPKYFENMFENAKESKSIAIVGLGDVWTNNMLFKYGSKGQILDFKFLDFQICRCCSRAIDLGYFIHTSADMDLINEKHSTLLKTYFDEFVSFAQKLGVSSEDRALDYGVFLQEYEDHRYYGFMMGLMGCPMMFAEKEDIPDMDEISEEQMKSAGGMDGFFNDMMKGDGLVKKIKDMVTRQWPKAKLTLKKWE